MVQLCIMNYWFRKLQRSNNKLHRKRRKIFGCGYCMYGLYWYPCIHPDSATFKNFSPVHKPLNPSERLVALGRARRNFSEPSVRVIEAESCTIQANTKRTFPWTKAIEATRRPLFYHINIIPKLIGHKSWRFGLHTQEVNVPTQMLYVRLFIRMNFHEIFYHRISRKCSPNVTINS